MAVIWADLFAAIFHGHNTFFEIRRTPRVRVAIILLWAAVENGLSALEIWP